MLARNGQFVIIIVKQTTAHHVRLNMEIVATQTGFEGHLPNTGGAKVQPVAGVLDQLSRLDRQAIWLPSCPAAQLPITANACPVANSTSTTKQCVDLG